MQMTHALPTQAKVSILSLEMLETGTYNPLYTRAYVLNTQGDILQNINNRVEMMNGAAITPEALGGIAGQALKPSAQVENVINIPNGWNERRIRFLMDVVVESPNSMPVYYKFQGFTSHLGVHDNAGQLVYDPHMEFVINSFIRLNDRHAMGPNGPMVERVVTQSCQIINGHIVKDPSQNDAFSMRPSDIFTGVQNGYLQQAYSSYNGSKLDDTRINFTGESIGSMRNNCLPSNYMHKVIDSYQTAKDMMQFGQDEADIYSRATTIHIEPVPDENHFIRALSHVRGMHDSTRFRISDLREIMPQIDHVLKYKALLPSARYKLSQAGMTAYFHGGDHEEIWASLLSNAIPAIMSDMMIGYIEFTSTNDSYGGQIITTPGVMKGLSGEDMVRNMRQFFARFENQIMRDLVFDGKIYHLTVKCSAYGDSTIDLKLGYGEMHRFVTPTWCDGLSAPVYTSQNHNYHNFIDTFDGLMNALPSGATMSVNTAI